ncbi:MAG: hypothetical protein KGY38_07470 [Desulfobacterales bacterium]|nr:hypothetical protein [Desulfobacterales bacterium]
MQNRASGVKILFFTENIRKSNTRVKETDYGYGIYNQKKWFGELYASYHRIKLGLMSRHNSGYLQAGFMW